MSVSYPPRPIDELSPAQRARFRVAQSHLRELRGTDLSQEQRASLVLTVQRMAESVDDLLDLVEELAKARRA